MAGTRDRQLAQIARVSIVIVTYRGDDVLLDCLASLKRTCAGVPQVIVVDNSPSPSTRRLVADFPNALYVESPGNPGFAGGNNKALPFCDREYVLLLNNDTVVRSASSIADLVDFMDRHPLCGVSQGSIVLPKMGYLAGGCGSFLTPFGFQYARGFAVPVASKGLERPVRCFSIMGAFMLFPKAVLAETGGFLFYDHFKSYYEESDFCHRVWLAGREVWYVPTAPIEHLCGHTAGMFSRVDIMRQYIRNSLFSLKVNLGWWGRLTVVPMYELVILGHAAVHLLRGDRATFKADLGICRELFASRRAIGNARRTLNRRVSDGRVFRQVLRLPPLSYFIRACRANA